MGKLAKGATIKPRAPLNSIDAFLAAADDENRQALLTWLGDTSETAVRRWRRANGVKAKT